MPIENFWGVVYWLSRMMTGAQGFGVVWLILSLCRRIGWILFLSGMCLAVCLRCMMQILMLMENRRSLITIWFFSLLGLSLMIRC